MKVELELTVAEQFVLAEIRHRGGFLMDEDAIACALWRFATFLDIDVPPEAFAIPFRPEMRALLEAERKRRDEQQPGLFSDETGDAGDEHARRVS